MATPTRSKLGRPSKGIRKRMTTRLTLSDHEMILKAAKDRQMDTATFLAESAKLVAQKHIPLPVEQTTK